jgi:hypothetical protein
LTPSLIGEGSPWVFWRFLPIGVPSGRWLNIMMNRIDPDLPLVRKLAFNKLRTAPPFSDP